MEHGFSTGRSLGAGLPGAKRLVHEFNLESEPGHTKITIAMVRRRSLGEFNNETMVRRRL